MENEPNENFSSLKLFSLTIPFILLGGWFIFFGQNFIPPDPPINITETVRDEEKLEKALKKIGIEKAMAKLIEESGGGSVYDCHQEAHAIGRIGYSIFKEKAFAECNASCHSGCYHGAMEIFLNEKGTENLAADIDQVCSTFKTSFGNFECLHGVGHGVLAYVDYDMPLGLSECRKLNGGFAQSSCFGGLFMENILTAQGLGASQKQDHATEWANRKDPHFPCNGIDKSEDIQHQCYLMQTSWMLTMYNYDFDKVAPECLKAPGNMKSVCYKSFGRDAAGHTLRNSQKIIEICKKVPALADYKEQCAIGAVNVIVDFWGPGLRHQATELCRLFDGVAEKACYDTLIMRLPDVFGPEKMAIQKEICDGMEDSYAAICNERIAANQRSFVPAPMVPQSSALQNEVQPSSDTVGTLPSVIIEISSNGFSPKELTIQTGQTVIFWNKDSELHWPASNIHPSHKIYPEFDPKRGIEANQNWSFKFNRAGTWRFHDHLYPERTGVITVK